jgi:16S rRNA (uracil1498-N3)-methyltransferase
MGSDSAVNATDGNGHVYKCKLAAEVRDGGEVEILETVMLPALSPAVHLYIGLPDRDAFEEALTGLAALGASRIVPVVCGYCQAPWWDSWDKRVERMQRKMIAGIKQAHNPWLPDLSAPLPFNDAVATAVGGAGGRGNRIVADPGGSGFETAFQGGAQVERIDCFVGPPGGFSPGEQERFSEGKFTFLKVAHYRLRTELAAIVACSAIMQRFIANHARESRRDLPDVE